MNNQADNNTEQDSVVEEVKNWSEGKIEFSDLNEDVREKVLNGDFEYQPQASEDVPSDESNDEVEVQPEDNITITDDTDTKPNKKKSKKRKKALSLEEAREVALERAQKINELTQQQGSHEHKLKTDVNYRNEYFKKLGIDNSEPTDIWDDNFQKQSANELKLLQAQVAEMRQEKEINVIYNQLEGFAKKQGYVFDSSVSEIDKAVKALESSNGRAPTTDEIAAFGFDTDDVEMYNNLVEVQTMQHQKGYPTFESAWYDSQRTQGKAFTPTDTTDAAPSYDEIDQTARMNKMKQALGQPKVMGSQRSAQADKGITPEYAMRWYEQHPDPDFYSDGDMEIHRKIQKMQGLLD